MYCFSSQHRILATIAAHIPFAPKPKNPPDKNIIDVEANKIARTTPITSSTKGFEPDRPPAVKHNPPIPTQFVMTQQQMTARQHQTWECARTQTQTHRDTQTHWNGHSAKIVRCQQYAPCHVSVKLKNCNATFARCLTHDNANEICGAWMAIVWRSHKQNKQCRTPAHKINVTRAAKLVSSWNGEKRIFRKSWKFTESQKKYGVSATPSGPPPVKPGEAPGVSQNTPAQQTKPWMPRSWIRCRRSHSLVAVSRHGPG